MATKPTYSDSQYENGTTLALQVERLKHYIGLLRQEAKYLGNELTGDDADKLEKIADSSDLQAITEAILTIEKQIPDQTGDAASGYTLIVPKGYYDSEYSFEFAGTDNSTEVDNAPVPTDVVDGKDYWANGQHLTGTLADYSKETDPIDAKSTTTSTANEGDTITITVNTGKYSEDNTIDTGIIARNPVLARDTTTGKINGIDVTEAGIYQPIVAQTTDAETGATTFTVTAVEIPAGYYENSIKVRPVFEDKGTTPGHIEDIINTTNKEITIDHSTDATHKWEYAPAADNADYYTGVKVNVAQAVLSDEVLTPTLVSNGNTATVTVPVTTAGYTDAENYTVKLKTTTPVTDKDTTVATKASATGLEITPDVADAQSVTIPAGLYTSDTVIKVNSMAAGSKLTAADITLNEIPEDLTDGKYSVSVNVDKSGYIAEGDYAAGTLNKSVIKVGATSDDAAAAGTTETITTKSIVVKTEEGYTKGQSSTLTVQDAAELTLGPVKASEGSNATLTVTAGTKGWLDSNTILLSQSSIKTLVDNLTTVETLSYSSKNTKETESIANVSGAIVNSVDGSYYNKVDMSALLTELSEL